MLSLLFKDLIKFKLNQELTFLSLKKEIETLSNKLENIEEYYLEILLTRGKIELNVSIPLLIEHIYIYIQQGGNKNGRK